MYHYVYRITNILINKHYYGKRSSKIHPKEDLGVKYFSSSKDKKFTQDQKQNPQNYEYTIIAICDNSLEALELEIYLHDYFDVAKNENFYNRAKQTSVGWSNEGIACTKEQKAKISGHNSYRAIPIDVYNYYTNELIAKNVIAKVWCKEHKHNSSRLMETIKGNENKFHNTTKNSPNYNRCQTKGIYAVLHNDKPKNFSLEHIQKTKSKYDNYKPSNTIYVDIYNYYTNELIAKNVISHSWCKLNKYDNSALSRTLKADLTKPHVSTKNSINFNPRHTKGIYAVKSRKC